MGKIGKIDKLRSLVNHADVQPKLISSTYCNTVSEN